MTRYQTPPPADAVLAEMIPAPVRRRIYAVMLALAPVWPVLIEHTPWFVGAVVSAAANACGYALAGRHVPTPIKETTP